MRWSASSCHHLLALRRLGYDPFYVEDSGRWVYDPRINDLTGDASGNIAAVAPVLEAHGFGERWAFRGNYPDGQCYGMTESQVLQLYREAFQLNHGGYGSAVAIVLVVIIAVISVLQYQLLRIRGHK